MERECAQSLYEHFMRRGNLCLCGLVVSGRAFCVAISAILFDGSGHYHFCGVMFENLFDHSMPWVLTCAWIFSRDEMCVS